ncbi:hypothetical protein PMIN04_003913 [Paraphaeosphaeria minitans]
MSLSNIERSRGLQAYIQPVDIRRRRPGRFESNLDAALVFSFISLMSFCGRQFSSRCMAQSDLHLQLVHTDFRGKRQITSTRNRNEHWGQQRPCWLDRTSTSVRQYMMGRRCVVGTLLSPSSSRISRIRMP